MRINPPKVTPKSAQVVLQGHPWTPKSDEKCTLGTQNVQGTPPKAPGDACPSPKCTKSSINSQNLQEFDDITVRLHQTCPCMSRCAFVLLVRAWPIRGSSLVAITPSHTRRSRSDACCDVCKTHRNVKLPAGRGGLGEAHLDIYIYIFIIIGSALVR